MAKTFWKNGVLSVIERVFIPDTTSVLGGGKTGLTFSSPGLVISTLAENEATATRYTQAGGTIETIISLGTFAAPTATKCRFKEVDSTDFPGVYEIQIADARWAVSGARTLMISLPPVVALGSGYVRAEIQLTALDPQDAVRGGMTALPNANAEAVGGLYTRGSGAGQINQQANGQVDTNVKKWSDTFVATPDTVGYPKVTIKDGTGTGELDTTSGKVDVNDKTGFSLLTSEHTAIVADAALALSNAGYSPTRAGYLDVLNGIVAAVQSGLATAAGLSSLQAHGDSTWATANVAALLTTVAFNSALATLSSHGDSTWSTANISSLLTSAAFNTALSALQAHGDSTWATGDLSGLLTTTAFNAAIAVLEGLVEDVPTAVENREEMDENSVQLAVIKSSTDLLSSNSTVITNPVILQNNTLVLYKSDDYTSESGRTLPRWSSDDWTDYDLPNAQSLSFFIGEQNVAPQEYGTLTALDETILQLEIEADEMTVLHSGTSRYSYKVIAQLSVALGGDIITLIDSTLIVKNYFNIRD